MQLLARSALVVFALNGCAAAPTPSASAVPVPSPSSPQPPPIVPKGQCYVSECDPSDGRKDWCDNLQDPSQQFTQAVGCQKGASECMACGRSEWYNSKCYGGSKEQCFKVCNALDGGVLECKGGCLLHCLLPEDEQNAVVQESRNPSKQPVGRDTNSGKYDPYLYTGSCYIGKCAPGGSRPDSCGPESEFVQSKYCQESQANCESTCGNQALNEPAVWDDRKCLGGSYSSCSAVCPYAHKTLFGRGICRLLCGVHCVLKELKESDIMTVEDGHTVLKADIVASL